MCRDDFVHPCCAQVHLRSAFRSVLRLSRLQQLSLLAHATCRRSCCSHRIKRDTDCDPQHTDLVGSISSWSYHISNACHSWLGVARGSNILILIATE